MYGVLGYNLQPGKNYIVLNKAPNEISNMRRYTAYPVVNTHNYRIPRYLKPSRNLVMYNKNLISKHIKNVYQFENLKRTFNNPSQSVKSLLPAIKSALILNKSIQKKKQLREQLREGMKRYSIFSKGLKRVRELNANTRKRKRNNNNNRLGWMG
jgi:hypothetical protein